MSLKHKNTSKWSKAQNRYAKFSDRAREQVQEQLEISKKLTKKVKQLQKEQDSEEEAYNTNNNENQENKTINLLPNGLLDNNPWMRMMGDVGIIKSTLANENDLNKDEFYNNQDYSRPKAFVDGNELKKAQDELDRKIDEHDDNTDDEINNKFKHSDLIHIFDKNIEENEDEKKNEVRYNKKKENENKIEKKAKINKVELLNKDDVINNYEVKKYDEKKKDEKNISPIESINLKGVNLSTKKNDDEKHKITLGEAFADDDVIEEFKDEKVSLFITLFFK
jgi:U3 small nucleolar RNA-associated protein 14